MRNNCGLIRAYIYINYCDFAKVTVKNLQIMYIVKQKKICIIHVFLDVNIVVSTKNSDKYIVFFPKTLCSNDIKPWKQNIFKNVNAVSETKWVCLMLNEYHRVLYIFAPIYAQMARCDTEVFNVIEYYYLSFNERCASETWFNVIYDI